MSCKLKQIDGRDCNDTEQLLWTYAAILVENYCRDTSLLITATN